MNNDTIKVAPIGTKRKFLEPGTIYHSNNYGDFVYVSEAGYRISNQGKRTRMVKIRFVDTGYECIVRFSAANKGAVKDPYHPTVCGVGYRGGIQSSEYTKEEYDMWFHMLNRVYNKNNHAYNLYGGAGITVDPRWHSLENFIHDIHEFPEYKNFKGGYRGGWALDKDIKQKDVPMNQRHYGPDTCTLVPADVNSRAVGLTNVDKASSKYLGVHLLSNGKYQARIMINGLDIFLGTYTNEIAAANMYNHIVSRLYHSNIEKELFLNQVPYMSIDECLTYKKMIPIKLPKTISIPEIRKYNRECVKPNDDRRYFKENNGTIICTGLNKPFSNNKCMYALTNIPDEERRRICLEKYGVDMIF